MNELEVNPAPVPEKKDSDPEMKHRLILAVSALSLLLSIGALIMGFSKAKPEAADTTVATQDGNITIAWINMDTISEKYKFYEELQNGMLAFEKKLQDQLAANYASFEKEYNAYMEKAASYSLSTEEKKRMEEQLGQKQQALQELQLQLSQQADEERLARQREVQDTITNFIARYNKKYHYTCILEKSMGGTLLWADKGLEITGPVLKGLNEEYQARKNQKADK